MLTSWEQHGLVLLALVCCLCGAVPGRALPALTLAKSALPSVVRPGDMITYTLVYRNTGPTTATGVVLTDPLPAHLTYVLGSANNTPTYNPVTRVLSWALGAMPPSGPTTSAQVTFKALVDTSAPLGQSLANTATIACNEVTTPVTGTTTTLVSAPALTLVKSASAATVQAGGAVTFTLSYANIGSGYATNVVLTDQLPRGLTLVPPSTTGVYNTATRLLTWKLGALNAAATGSVSFLATVDADTAVGAQLTNTAGILCSEVTNAVTSNVTITVILGGGHGDWWMFHHDVKHTGRSPYLGPSYATKKWAFPAGIIAYSSPALGADGAVYIGSDNANLYAINPDGTQRWAFPTGYFIRASPAVGPDGTVYIGSFDNHFYAINPDGSQRWSFNTNGTTYESSPVIGTDGTIYVGSSDFNLYAINPNGTKKWTFATTNVPLCSPAIGADGTIYVGSMDKNLYALNPNGTAKWVLNIGGNGYSSPAIATDGTIYIGSYDHRLYAVYPNGTKKWTFATGAIIRSSPAIGADGTVYVGSDDNYLYAITAYGTKKWAFATKGSLLSSPAIGADGTVYVGSGDGNLYAVDANGAQRWAFTAGNAIESSPSLGADGTVYVGSKDGNLYAITNAAPVPQFILTKAAMPTTSYPGMPVTFTLNYANTGTVPATNAVLTDPLPANLTFVNGSATNGPSYDSTARTLTWNLGTIPPGGKSVSYQLSFKATVDAGTPNGYQAVNIAALSCNELTSPIFSNTAVTTVLSTPNPALALVKTVAPSTSYPGTVVTYTLSYGNSGTAAAGSAVLTDVLPANLTYVQGSAVGASYNAAANTLTWSLGTLNAGVANLTRTFKATVSATAQPGATLTNTATLSADRATPATATADVTVAAVPLTLVKSTLLSTVPQGHTVIYYLTYNNTGASPFTKVMLTDPLPSYLTYVAGSASGGGSYNAGTRTLAWSLGTLNSGLNAQTVTFRAVVNTTTPVGSVITNTAAISCAELPAINSTTPVTVIIGSGRGDWWKFHHDIKNTGSSLFTGPAKPVVKWTFAGGAAFYLSSPAIGVDGTIYIGTDGNTYALNPNGTKKWSFPIPARSSPALGVDGTVYVGSQNNSIYAINPDGTKQWMVPAGQIESSPTVDTDGTSYIGARDNKVYVVNPDGSTKWTFTTGGVVDASPVLGPDGTVYVGSNDNNFYALNPDGSQKWVVTAGNIFYGSPAMGKDGTVYAGSDDKNVYAINPDGTKKWAFTAGGAIHSALAIGKDGTIYAGAADSNLYAINANGTKKWAFKAGNSGIYHSSPAIGADGTVYIGAWDGNLYAVNPDGTQKWAFATGSVIRVSPALAADGTLYFGVENGTFYALTSAAPAPALTLTKSVTPTQAWRGDKLTYTLVRGNTGNKIASNVTLTDVLPAHTTYVQGSALGAIYNANTRTLTWSLGILNAGATAQNTFQVTIDTAAATGFNIVNSALIYCTELPVAASSNTAVATVTIPPGRGDWWMIHHDPKHTGRSPFTGPGTAQKKWVFTATGVIDIVNPAIGADGSIYVGSWDGNLYAVNPDGTKKWSCHTGHPIRNSPAIATDGTIYTGSDGGFYAINPDGTQKWSFNVPMMRSSPVIGPDGTIYFGSDNNNLYAFTANGSKKWSYATGNSISSSPALGTDGTVYVGSFDNNLYAVSSTGTLKWKFKTGDQIVDPSPSIGTNGTVYIASVDHNVYAINPDGTKLWSFTTNGPVYSSPMIGADGTIYIGSSDGNVYAIQPDGTAKWMQPFITGGAVVSSAAIGADGTIYIGSEDSHIYAITPDGYQKWMYTTGATVRSSPTIGPDGTLYCGSFDCNLYAITNGPPAPALGIKKSVTPTNTWRGRTVTYTLVRKNAGNAPATNVTLTDVLPAHLTYVTGSASGGGTFNAATSALTWSLGTLNAGATAQVTFQAIINTDAATGLNIANTALIYCTEMPVAVASNTATVTVTLPTGGRGDWWMFHHDPQHSGRSPFTGPSTAKKKWAFTTGAYCDLSNPTFGADGTLYFGSQDGYAYAINPDGTKKWAYNTGRVIRSSPAIALDGTVYVGSEGAFYALYPDGSPKWSATVPVSHSSAVIAPDGTVYIGSDDANLYAFNPDGSKKWAFLTGGVIHASPALGTDGTIYIGSDDRNLYAVNTDGSKKWSFTAGNVIRAGATIAADGTIYVGSADQNLYALTPTGTTKWAQPFAGGDFSYSSPAIGADGSIYVGSLNSNFYAVTPNGMAKWAQPIATGDSIHSSPAIGADGTIYFGSDDHKIYAVTPEGYQRWTFTTGLNVRGAPSIGPDGTLYVGSWDGNLYAITTGPPAPALGLTKTVSPARAWRGDKVTYTLLRKNVGTAAATGVTLTDVLPAHTTYVTGSATGAVYNATTRTLAWSLGTLNAGASAQVTFQVTINNDSATGLNIANSALIYCTEMPAKVTSNLAVVTVTIPPGHGDWWMYLHDPQHTGRSSFVGPGTAQQKWVFATGNVIASSSPAIGLDGTIYIGSINNNLYAVNPDGSMKWAFNSGTPIDSSPAIGTDGTIYVGSFNKLYAVNADGTQKWFYATGNGIGTSPTIGPDGTIYQTSLDAKLYALNPNGTLKWSFTTGDFIRSSPAIGADGTIYIGSGDLDKNLYALTPSGTKKWSFATRGSVGSPAIGTDGTIYIGSADAKLYALNPDGTKKWEFFTNSIGIGCDPSIGPDGTIYIGTLSNYEFAVNPDGTQKWAFASGKIWGSAAAISADGTIYFGAYNHNIYALTPDGYQKWSMTTGDYVESSPSIGADGTLYIGSHDGNLYAITNGPPAPALGIKKSVSPTSAAKGATITYTILRKNAGNKTATNVTLTDVLPAHLTYVTGSATAGGSYNAATSALTWSLGTLNAGATAQVTFQATINTDAATGMNIDNTAQIVCTEMPVAVASNTATVTVIGPPGRGDWFMFQHDLQHTGRSSFNGPSTASQKWAFSLGMSTNSSPAIGSNGTIYVGSYDGNLYALNPDGTKKWAFTTGDRIDSSPTIGTDGTIYVGSYDGNLYAINPDGSKKWSFNTTGGIYSSPAIGADGTIYIGTSTYNFYAINPDGTKKWTYNTPNNNVDSCPAIGTDGTIYFKACDGNLFALNPDGTKKWIAKTNTSNLLGIVGQIISSVSIGKDGTIYVPSWDNNLYAINPDGTKKWAFASAGINEIASPAIGADGTIYLGSSDNNLYAINPDGTKKWAFATGKQIYATPAIGADGIIYIGSSDSNCYAINPDGSQKWKYTIGSSFISCPAIGADGSLYLSSQGGKLYAIGN